MSNRYGLSSGDVSLTRRRLLTVTDYVQSWPKARETIAAAIKDGKFSTSGSETRVPATFEEIPQVWKKLFSVRFTVSAALPSP